MPRQDLGARALKFSVEILALNRRLLPKSERFGGALNQLVRSATAISLYWLRLLSTDPLVGNIDPLIGEANEWVAMLTTTVKKLRS